MKIQEVETEYNRTVSQPQHQPTQVAAQVDTVGDSLHLCTISQYSYNSLEHEFIQRLSTISTIRYQIWENFGVEKIGKFGKQNACHSPILSHKPLPYILSCSCTSSLFANILSSNWFGLAHSSIFYPTKIFPCTVAHFGEFITNMQLRKL